SPCSRRSRSRGPRCTRSTEPWSQPSRAPRISGTIPSRSAWRATASAAKAPPTSSGTSKNSSSRATDASSDASSPASPPTTRVSSPPSTPPSAEQTGSHRSLRSRRPAPWIARGCGAGLARRSPGAAGRVARRGSAGVRGHPSGASLGDGVLGRVGPAFRRGGLGGAGLGLCALPSFLFGGSFRLFGQDLEPFEAGGKVPEHHRGHEEGEVAEQGVLAHVALHPPDHARSLLGGLEAHAAGGWREAFEGEAVLDAGRESALRGFQLPGSAVVPRPLPASARAAFGAREVALHPGVSLGSPCGPLRPPPRRVQEWKDVRRLGVDRDRRLDAPGGGKEESDDTEQDHEAEQPQGDSLEHAHAAPP